MKIPVRKAVEEAIELLEEVIKYTEKNGKVSGSERKNPAKD